MRDRQISLADKVLPIPCLEVFAYTSNEEFCMFTNKDREADKGNGQHPLIKI